MSEIPEDVMKMARHYANETSPPGQQPIEQHNHRKLAFAREIGARLARINGERVFIDDIPADWPTTDPIAPHCDFLCVLAGKDMEDAA